MDTFDTVDLHLPEFSADPFSQPSEAYKDKFKDLGLKLLPVSSANKF